MVLNTSARFAKRGLWDTQARLLLGVAVSLALGWLSVRGMEWGLVVDQFRTFPVGWAFVVAVASVLAVPLLIWVSRKSLLSRIPLLVSTAVFMSDLARAKFSLGYALLMTLVHWLLVGVCAWVLAYGMGLGISAFVATLANLGTIYFTNALPALPAAVGTFEFAIVYVLKFFGVPHALAFSYGVVIHAVLFLPPIVVAMAVFSSIGVRPLRQGDSMRSLDESRAVSVDVDDQERKTK